MAERDAVPARGGSSLPLPGGLGISLPALGPAREVHRWKCHRGWRDSCRVWPLCHEAWPRLSLGMNSPIGTEPWWDAERRARSALRAPHPKRCGGWIRVCRRSASLLFSVLTFVARSADREATGVHRRYSLAKIGAEGG